MKKWFFLLLPLAFVSCSEVPPYIDMNPVIDTTLTDTTYMTTENAAPHPKIVLLEDFTGVRCVNCPTAQERARQIYNDNPGRVVLAALHVMEFAQPHTNSIHDFRTPEGTAIVQMLGEPPGLPMGAIDRLQFSGETAIMVSFNKWEAYVQQQLLETSAVNIELERQYNPANRELTVKATLTYTGEVAEDNYLSISLLESKVIDYQTTPQGIKPDYEHNHNLRRMLTPHNGVALNASLEKGRVFVKEFRAILPESWVDQHMEIIGFVHERGSSYKVLQTGKIDL